MSRRAERADNVLTVDDALRSDLLRRFHADQHVLSSLYAGADTYRPLFDRTQEATDTPWPFAILEWAPETEAPPLVQEALRRVRRNTQFLRDLVGDIGWPGRDVVGEDGADAAWLLLQHAGAGVRTLDSPANRSFRHECVPLLDVAVLRGVAHPRHLAHTVDGILSVEGGAPCYAVLGSAFISDRPGVRLASGLDAAKIDANRRRIGLVALAEDLRLRASGRVPGAALGEQPEPWPGQPGQQ